MLKNVRKGYRENLSFLDMGEKWFEKIYWTQFFFKLEKNRVKEILGLCFFPNHFSPMSGTTKNDKFSLYPFLTFFSTRVLETHLGGLKAACIDPALSKFRPSVGDGATYPTPSTVHTGHRSQHPTEQC